MSQNRCKRAHLAWYQSVSSRSINSFRGICHWSHLQAPSSDYLILYIIFVFDYQSL